MCQQSCGVIPRGNFRPCWLVQAAFVRALGEGQGQLAINLLHRPGVAVPGCAARDVGRLVGRGLDRWRQGSHRKGRARLPVDQHTDIGLILRKRKQVGRQKIAAEVLRQNLGVALRALERYGGSDVAEQAGPGRFVELLDELTGDRQCQSVLSGLRENRGKSFGGEVAEFVDLGEEIAAVLLGHVGPTHGGELQGGHEQGT